MKKIKVRITVPIILAILLAGSVSALSEDLNVTVVETQNISLVFAKINNVDDFDSVVNRNANFVKAIFPVSDSGLTFFKNKSGVNGPATFSSDPNNLTKELNNIRKDLLTKAYLAQQKFTNVIGVVEQNYLDPIETGATGLNLNPGVADVILVDETQLKTTAHEVGHTFRLCDEYNANDWAIQNGNFSGGCPNGDVNNDGILDANCLSGDGCPAQIFAKLYVEYRNISDNLSLRNFMGGSDTPTYPLPSMAFESWISNGSYDVLLDRLNIATDFDVEMNTFIKIFGKYLIFRINFEQNGTTEVLDAHILENGFVHNASAFSGNYTIEILNESGGIISDVNFEPVFSITTESGNDTETNLTFIIFALPLNNQTPSTIRFKNQSLLLAEMNRTANVPIINLSSTLENEVFDKSLDVSWNASDADNDTINYAVLISSDNGSTFTALEVDYANTSLTIDTTSFVSSSQYRIKILATDGVNTANVTSDIFTVSHLLDVLSLQSIHSVSDDYLFEFLIKNGGDSEISNINWTLDFGDGSFVNSSSNSSLSQGEQMFVYVQNAYGEQGTYSVVATVQAGANIDSESISIEVVHLGIDNLSVINISGTQRLFEFSGTNFMSSNLTNVSWIFDTGNSFKVNNSVNASLNTGEDFFVFIDYDYGTTGSFVVNASANNNSISDYEVLGVEIT